jgi:DNA-binding HxlR family transcriptional regulator
MSSVTRNVRTYDHFCLMARALEQVGDRWSLLVVRDLITGPKRFTDLTARLGGITPKTLSQRLRELADAGIVTDDREPGRREVRYRLTAAGSDLGPVVDSLTWWGFRHAWRWPQPGEQLHVEHLLGAVVGAMEHATDGREGASWHFRFPDDDYVMAYDGLHWTLTAAPPMATPDVTITATTDAFIQFLFGQSSGTPAIDIAGDRPAVLRFERLIRAFADSVGDAGVGG